MERNSGTSGAAERFFAGWGFYIVLALCIVLIGVSAWVLLTPAEEAAAGEETLSASAERTVSVTPAIRVQAAAKSAAVPAAAETEAEPAITEAEAVQPPAVETASLKLPEAEPVSAAAETEPVLYIWPVSGGVERGYSADALAYDPTMRDWRTHAAVDLGAELGETVSACAAGTVEDIYEDALLGTVVVLNHGGGLRSLYANLAAVPTVAVGDRVELGQTLGAVGTTALGEVGEVCHLHFAISRDGTAEDPLDYLPDR